VHVGLLVTSHFLDKICTIILSASVTEFSHKVQWQNSPTKYKSTTRVILCQWRNTTLPAVHCLKGELGEIQVYFRKIPLYQQKFLMVSVLSSSPWLLRYLKNVQNETTKRFSVGNTKVNILALISWSRKLWITRVAVSKINILIC